MRILPILLSLLFSTSPLAAPATYRIDPEHFSIAFMIEHIGYAKVIGQFSQASGEFVYDEQAQVLSSGSVEIRAASVNTHHEQRDVHVRNRDFLDTDAHPSIRFRATQYRPDEGSTGILRGDLTLLGQTHPVELKIRLNRAAAYPFGHRRHTLGISATTTLRRSQWGMSYGVTNAMVGDAVELMFEFEALRQ
jgi:polyisoprenoid-binding protein YceI